MSRLLQVLPPLPAGEATTAERVELVVRGFTAEEIEQLCKLRALHPLVEFVDSPQELRRLVLLKWLHRQEHDDVDEPPAAA